jgi:hypothetical protein
LTELTFQVAIRTGLTIAARPALGGGQEPFRVTIGGGLAFVKRPRSGGR